MELAGKRILVTGEARASVSSSLAFLADNNQVIVAGRDESRLERARSHTPTLYTRRLDVTSEDGAREAIAWLKSEFAGLDVLVNNAGLLRNYPLSAADAFAESIEDVEVNLVGALRMSRLTLPLLQASPEGALVFISSAVALAAVPGFAVYAATPAPSVPTATLS